MLKHLNKIMFLALILEFLLSSSLNAKTLKANIKDLKNSQFSKQLSWNQRTSYARSPIPNVLQEPRTSSSENSNSKSTISSIIVKPLTTMISTVSAVKDKVLKAVSTVTSPIDNVTKRAVSGAGLALGAINGMVTKSGVSTFNSLVKVHNTNVENLQKLKKLTKNVGHSVVDLGSTVVSETANVMDSIRKENNRVIKKATDGIPVVRHVTSLANVVGMAGTKGLSNIADRYKKIGNLMVDSSFFEKSEAPPERDNLISNVLSEMNSNILHTGLCIIAGRKGLADMTPEAAFDTGNFVGRTMGAAKFLKAAVTGNPL